MAKKSNGNAVPQKHWEIQYSQWKPSKNMELTKGSDFVAKSPTERKTTHLQVNKEDH